MKKTRIVALIMVVCFVFGLITACGSNNTTTTKAAEAQTEAAQATDAAQPADDGTVYTIKFSHSWPETHPLAIRWAEWGEAIEERTNGRIQVEMFGAAQLATDAENYESMCSGMFDCCVIYAGYTPGLFPLTEMLELPVGYNSTMSMGQVFNDLFDEFEMEEWDEVKVLGVYAIGPGAIVTKKAVQTLDDLKGLQIRGTGMAAKCLTALGASPVSVTMPESYEALSRGTVDGVIGAWASFETWSLDEVADNYTAMHFMYATPFIFTMSKDTFNSLPEDLQKIVEDTSKEWCLKHCEWAGDDDTEGIASLTEKGKNLYVLSDEDQAKAKELVKSVCDEAITEREAQGLDAQKFYDRMVELVEKYNAENTSFDDLVKESQK